MTFTSREKTRLLDQFSRDELLDALIRTIPSYPDTKHLHPKLKEERLVDLFTVVVRQWHNESTLIRRLLPNEILAEIFSCLHPRHLIPASQTCHHWRQVALRSPQLWVDIDFKHPLRAVHYLERSKSAPIFVTLPLHAPASPLLELFVPHLHRTRTLNLSVCISNNMPALAFPPAPQLRALAIRGHTKLDIAPILPTVFSPGTTPRLEDLSFRHAFPSWDSPIFTGLIRLTLDGTRGQAQPSVLDILLVLQNNPCLEFFHLTTSEALVRTEPYTTTISLSRITQFELNCPSPVDIYSLLNSISLPPIVHLVLFTTLTLPGHSISTFLPSKAARPPISQLTLQPMERGNGILIQGSNASGDHLLNIKLQSAFAPNLVLRGVGDVINADTVETLSVFSLPLCSLVLSWFPRLRCLSLQNMRRVDVLIDSLENQPLSALVLHSTDVSPERLLAFVSSHALDRLDHQRNLNGAMSLDIISRLQEVVRHVNL